MNLTLFYEMEGQQFQNLVPLSKLAKCQGICDANFLNIIILSEKLTKYFVQWNQCFDEVSVNVETFSIFHTPKKLIFLLGKWKVDT